MKKFSRRLLLKAGITSAVSVPAAYIIGVTHGNYPPREGLRYLSSKDAAIVEALGETIIPNENEIGLNIKQMGLAQEADRLVEVFPAHLQRRFKTFLWAVEHVLPLRCLYFKKFTRLAVSQRQQILEKFDSSKSASSRSLVRLIKALIQTTYYNDSRVLDRINFKGHCLI